MRSGYTCMPSTIAAELHEHVVREQQRVGEDDALDRRVRDVALVPQRDVLERRPAGCRAAPGRGRRAARDFTGLRLCGIALEPFCAPARNGSSTSRTSVRWRWRISSGERLDRRADRRARVEQLGVAVAGEHLRGGHRREPELLAHVAPRPRDRRWSRCRPRPTACRPRSRARARASRSRSRRTCSAQSASLAPNVVGSAWMPCVRPTIGVSRNSWAWAAIAASSAAAASSRRSTARDEHAATSAVSTTSLDVRP